MEWLKAALSGQVNRSLSGSVGLWEFSRQLDGERPYRQLVPTGPVLEQRQALLDGIAGLKPVSATQLYTSLLALYEDAQENYQEGKRNSVVVLTDGPNDGGLGFDELRTRLEGLKRADRQIPVNIIAMGSAPERDPLNRITQSTGGTFSVAEDGRAIDAALAQILSAG
jgi:Ca-activated chloride channel homolog